MVVVPAGEFRMGDNQGKHGKDELPVQEVKIQKPFAVSRYEITFDQYDQFAKATGRELPDDEGFGRGRQPVIRVSWHDAVAYAKWLFQQTSKRYRLPTEAEWEYAARAGTDTAYWWGNEMKQGLASCIGCGSQWDGKQAAPVGSFKPNSFGLYDATQSGVRTIPHPKRRAHLIVSAARVTATKRRPFVALVPAVLYPLPNHPKSGFVLSGKLNRTNSRARSISFRKVRLRRSCGRLGGETLEKKNYLQSSNCGFACALRVGGGAATDKSSEDWLARNRPRFQSSQWA
jgi:hypothetical protein